MRRVAGVLAAFVVVLGSGCAPSRVVLRGASNTDAVDLARCAKRQLEHLGFAVRDVGPEDREVRAVKNTSSTRSVLLSGKDSEDRIVVTTESAGPDGGGVMSAAGESLFWGKDNRKLREQPSRDIRLQARRIFEACGILDAVQIAAP